MIKERESCGRKEAYQDEQVVGILQHKMTRVMRRKRHPVVRVA